SSGSASGSPSSQTSASASSSGPGRPPPASTASRRSGRSAGATWTTGFEPMVVGVTRLDRPSARRDAVVAMATVPLLAVRGLTKSFGGRRILDGLDLDVAAGARIGVLGPNGGGKSTLLRILAGLASSDAGTVTRRRGL